MPNGTNHTPMKDAVALAYLGGSHAPRVVAKGHGLIAEEIIARAKEHGVFIHESKELVNLLMQVDLDRDIPPALYRAVAELLAWLYALESELSPSEPRHHASPAQSLLSQTASQNPAASATSALVTV